MTPRKFVAISAMLIEEPGSRPAFQHDYIEVLYAVADDGTAWRFVPSSTNPEVVRVWGPSGWAPIWPLPERVS